MYFALSMNEVGSTETSVTLY